MSSAFETGQSTPESTEDDSTGDHWHQSQGDEAHTEQSTADEAHSDGNARKQQLPMQKRRRVTRACDECRRKKIKCDGKQPCTHCTVYSYDCTYDQPSNRRRNPAPQYIEALEHRLQKAEALLKTVLPDVDLSTVEESQTDTTDGVIDSVAAAKSRANDDSATIGAEKDSLLESMVESTGQLDLDDQGKWDFHGHSSGMMFLSRIREQFGDIMPIPDMRTSGWLKPQLHNSSRSVSDSPMDSNLPNVAELPSKEVALELASNSLDYACSLLRFVHQPSFYRMLDRIYSVPPVEFGDEENRFLPLLYVVLALGCLFAPNEKSELEQGGYENAVNQGFKYFLACRHMIEITDCRDLISLQAVLFMVMFLQSSAKLSTCYSYIGIALRSALRMGLHRSINGKFNPIELETRKRMFWVIRKMDTYVAALLGLPKTLSDDDIDQDLPLEIDDEFITAQGITPMPPGRFSIYAAPNAHTKLVLILAKVIKYVYPIKGPTVSRERCHSSYVVSHAKIREIERDLHDWRENLPSELQPGSPVPPDVERVQQLLRMAYAHVQMLLYRPFLHYASHKFHSKKVDKRSYACAAACISVSRNIIHITSNMKSRGLLIGAYWLTMYTTFFAIISLVFYVLENRDDETSAACFKDASEGKDALASLARRSNAADRCMITLNTLFDQLPARLKRERSKPAAPKKKRSAPTAQPPSSKASESQPNMPVHNSTDHIKRANTFPVHLNPPSRQRASIPNDGTSHRRELLSTDSANRRSLHEFSSISSSPGSGTPDSNPGALPLSANFGLFQQPNFGNNGSGVPELGAMMFPSDDPFAYPNQPMTIFENHQSIDPAFGALLNQSPNGTLFKAEPNSNNSPQYDMEAQLFGPMPPYMMQGQQVSAGPAPNAAGLSMAGMNMNPDEMYQQNQSTGLSPGVNMEDIFSGEEWSNLLMEQNMRP